MSCVGFQNSFNVFCLFAEKVTPERWVANVKITVFPAGKSSYCFSNKFPALWVWHDARQSFEVLMGQKIKIIMGKDNFDLEEIHFR